MMASDDKDGAVTLQSIGVIRSPYKEKFAVPRQPNIVPDITGELYLFSPYGTSESVRGLETFSHLWLLFLFHHTRHQGWHPTVRPPRLGGNERVGIFATRSTFRPNPIGLSSVELRGITCSPKGVVLRLGSLDLIDGTPILDIKPYLPYADSYPNARSGYAAALPEATLSVRFSEAAERHLACLELMYPALRHHITDVLRYDPRPAYKKNRPDKKHYYLKLYEFTVVWQVIDDHIDIIDIGPLTP